MSDQDYTGANSERDNRESRKSDSDEEILYATATPSKTTYESLSSDITVKSAVGELIDNALDSAALHGYDVARISISLEQEDGEEVLVVRDECGGVPKEDMGVFMGLGRSREERADDQQVGTFKLGAKRGLRRLGSSFTIKSRYLKAEQGWAYTVPAEWFETDEEDPSDWKFELTEADLDEGVTELRISNLEFDWHSERDELKDWIATTYQKFLQNTDDPDLDLDVTVDGDSIVPPEPVDWSYSPWLDGLHPRRFKGLRFTDNTGNGEVHARVTVGILREGDQDRCGTFVFGQHRLIEGNLTDEDGGFGLSDGLNQFKLSQHKRLRIEIELFGDAGDLPWSADKSRLRPGHSTLSVSPNRGVYWWLRRMADRYMKAAKYGSFNDFVKTDAVFKPYAADSDGAAHGGKIEVVDLGDKQRRLLRGEVDHIRITNKPSSDLTVVNHLGKVADAHARLGIVADSVENILLPGTNPNDHSPDTYEQWARPTYHHMIGHRFIKAYYDASNREFTDEQGRRLLNVDDADAFMRTVVSNDEYSRIARQLTSVTTVPNIGSWRLNDDSDDGLDDLLSDIRDVAVKTVEGGRRRQGGPEWATSYYEAAVAAHASEDERDAFEAVDTPVVTIRADVQDLDAADVPASIANEDRGGSTVAVTDSEGDGEVTTEEITADLGTVIEGLDEDGSSGNRRGTGTGASTGIGASTSTDSKSATTTSATETDSTTNDESFRDFCRENSDILENVDDELLAGDLEDLKTAVREQLKDGQTFRQIRDTESSTSSTEAE